MPEIIFRGNLSSANFPLATDFMGRSVVIPQYDENYIKRAKMSGADLDLDIGIPQIYYCHNVMPGGQGFKSIGYSTALPEVSGVTDFVQCIPLTDAVGNSGLLGFTESGDVYMFSAVGGATWNDITADVAGWTGGEISYAVVNGITYVCLSLHDVYIADLVGVGLTSASLTGIVASSVVGICGAANYLLLHDTTKVYWSSTIDIEDFVPSILTGAGSGTPTGLLGTIVCMLPLASGFIVYSTKNMITATYSGNSRFPWSFIPSKSSRGITSSEHVTYEGDDGISYAWTSAGVQKITQNGCVNIFPEVTDFMAGKLFEDFNTSTQLYITTYLQNIFNIKLSYISARYLVISYGITSLTHALVYDSTLERWGKLKIDHVDCFEFNMSLNTPAIWSQLIKWEDYIGVSWGELVTIGNGTPEVKRTLAFLQSDGTVKVAVFDYVNTSSDAVLLLGKFQLQRSDLCALQGLVLESVDDTNANFFVRIIPTLDGKTFIGLIAPYELTRSFKTREYTCRVVGTNVSILLQGSFNIVSFVLRMTNEGHR